jgi:hypothetical protein
MGDIANVRASLQVPLSHREAMWALGIVEEAAKLGGELGDEARKLLTWMGERDRCGFKTSLLDAAHG